MEKVVGIPGVEVRRLRSRIEQDLLDGMDWQEQDLQDGELSESGFSGLKDLQD